MTHHPNNIEELFKRINHVDANDIAWKEKFGKVLLAHMRHTNSWSLPFFGAFVQKFFSGRRDIVAPHYTRTTLTPMPLLISLFVVLFGTVGTSFAAEQSLPGDFLFPVKVEVNERVASALRVSSQDQAEFSVSLVAKRIHEVAELEAHNKLLADDEKEITARLNQSIADAHEAIDAAADENEEAATEASQELESTLRVGSGILAHVHANATHNAEISGTVGNIKTRLDDEADASVKTTLGLETREREHASMQGLEMSATSKVAAAQHRLDAAERQVKRAEEQHLEGAAEARVTLNKALTLLADAKVALGASDWINAFVKAQAAIRLGSEAQVRAHAGVGLHFNNAEEDQPENKNDSLHSESSIEEQGSAPAQTNGNSSGSAHVDLNVRSLLR